MAAKLLAISHPVISKTIADLEHALGIHLLDRSAQGVELTVYGEALLKCGTAVFDEMRQELKQIEFLSSANSGELRIGCSEVIAAGPMPVIAERFFERHPGVKLISRNCGRARSNC
jgi:DNA-binding transcriptional LysR family regulator